MTQLTSSTTSLFKSAFFWTSSHIIKKTFFISTISGETISRSINRHRIHSFILLLHNTRLVLVGIESNNVIFSFIHSITTHKHNHHGSHISAKDLLPTQAGKKRFRSVIHCYHQATPSRACFFPAFSSELVFHVLLNSLLESYPDHRVDRAPSINILEYLLMSVDHLFWLPINNCVESSSIFMIYAGPLTNVIHKSRFFDFALGIAAESLLITHRPAVNPLHHSTHSTRVAL